jgi:hypothetical protein
LLWNSNHPNYFKTLKKNWQCIRQFYNFSNLLRTVVLYQKPIL